MAGEMEGENREVGIEWEEWVVMLGEVEMGWLRGMKLGGMWMIGRIGREMNSGGG
ncbi:hypothetical protein [Paenibacillus xylanexedens]|uniref:hypothetical protein n=1 Tax=Paenibacillus xylanexedens TaxID=528191 RepID=UPI0016424552|nr:hypothetical protein [Paenibacillus xylanexedens]